MTNKYLEKIAASMADERDAAKTYAKATASGWGGYLAGGAVGGLAAAGLASTKLGKGLIGAGKSSRIIRKAKVMGRAISRNPTYKKYKGALAAGGAGALVGSHLGEESGHYAATRQGVLEAKQNARNER